MPRSNSEKSMFFYQNLPSLDLHGETKDSTDFLVRGFINDNLKLGNEKVVIVHGIGTGVLKKKVHDILKNDKNVVNFYINFFNVGCTIVELKQKFDK